MTLDEDVAQMLRQRMREQGRSFKETVNDLLRRGLRGGSDVPTDLAELPKFNSAIRPGVDLTKALSLAAALEDEELVRKLELRK